MGVHVGPGDPSCRCHLDDDANCGGLGSHAGWSDHLLCSPRTLARPGPELAGGDVLQAWRVLLGCFHLKREESWCLVVVT